MQNHNMKLARISREINIINTTQLFSKGKNKFIDFIFKYMKKMFYKNGNIFNKDINDSYLVYDYTEKVHKEISETLLDCIETMYEYHLSDPENMIFIMGGKTFDELISDNKKNYPLTEIGFKLPYQEINYNQSPYYKGSMFNIPVYVVPFMEGYALIPNNLKE